MNNYFSQDFEISKLTFDTDIIMPLLAKARFLQGKLMGKMESLGYELRREAHLETMIAEILKSAEIRKEILNTEQVRSSLAKHLDMNISGFVTYDAHIEGIVNANTDLMLNYDKPLSYEMLMNWNSSIFSKDEKIMSPIRDSNTYSKMLLFIDWFNREDKLDLLIKASIAHLWYVSINSFEKGSGVIARILTNILLSKSDESVLRFYSMSAQISEEQKAYYNMLEEAGNEMPDITSWIKWFLFCLIRSFKTSEQILAKVLYKLEFWNNATTASLNDRQRVVLNNLRSEFEDKLTAANWAKITQCSTDTALRDIKDLLKKRILKKETAGGRSSSYKLNNYQ